MQALIFIVVDAANIVQNCKGIAFFPSLAEIRFFRQNGGVLLQVNEKLGIG